MNAITVALCGVFAAVAIVLGRFSINLGPIIFYFWEIPIVVALLLFGFKLGFTVATVSIFAQAIIFPRPIGLLFPVWNLIAMSTTLVAVSLTQWIIARKKFDALQAKKSRLKPVFCFVSAALVVRLSVMPFVNYFMYKFMMPLIVGRVYSDVYLAAFIPLLLIYDAVLIFYTVPTSYVIAKKVNSNLKMGNTLL